MLETLKSKVIASMLFVSVSGLFGITYYLSNKIEAFRITYQTSDPFNDGTETDINQCINLNSHPFPSPVFN